MRSKWFLGKNIVKGMRWANSEFQYLSKHKEAPFMAKAFTAKFGSAPLLCAADRATVCSAWEADMTESGDKRFLELLTVRRGLACLEVE